jgi:hypothetical protein
MGGGLIAALTAPYAAHALIVVYYALVQPGRPIVLEPGQRWQSVWEEQKLSSSEAETALGVGRVRSSLR